MNKNDRRMAILIALQQRPETAQSLADKLEVSKRMLPIPCNDSRKGRMKAMEPNRLMQKAKRFIYENARLLDRRRYEYWFEGGAKQVVIAALASYRNEDGGWGLGFPAVSPAGELEWRGSLTVDRLRTLRAYGKI